MAHTWHFFRAGGVDQVAIRNGADLLALPELDQKLWVALAMPTRDVAIDPATMDLLDGDKDGRVRVPDIKSAVEWVGTAFKNADDLLKSSDSVALTAIKDAAIAGAAKRILADAGKSSASSIALADVLDAVKKFADTTLNGDGIVIPDAAGDDAGTKQAIEEAIAAGGGVTDRSGKPGVDQAKVDGFFADVDKAAAWHQAADGAAPLGADSGAAADALAAVKAKIEDYFARAALAAFDPRAVAGLNGQDAEFTALGAKALTSGADDIARLPLAKIEPGKPLALRAGVNPAWAAALATFADHAVKPVLGAKDAITADDFAKVVDKLAPVAAWRGAKPDTGAAKLDAARLKDLASGDARAKIGKLIEADKAVAGDYDAISSVERLCRFQRDLGRVVRNFVNFSDFYSNKDGAFQAGTLYLDGRAFSLTVPVSDAGKHGSLAGMSAAYLAYCEIKRKGASRSIAAAMTNGDSDNVFVGRNGIFYDRDGNDWDATITKVIANPISVREAFFAPYKKLVRLVEDQVNKRATEAEAKSSTKIDAAATKVATVDQAKPADPAAPPAPAKKGLDIGIIAMVSLAIGAVMGAVGGIIAMIVGMGKWAPLGIAALLLLISGPSMLLAWMKLRQRNLGPILDANGWAVNVKARVNVAFGASMTSLSALPSGATRSLEDPFADKKSPWKLYLALIVIVVLGASWYAGKLDKWLPRKVQSVQVIGKSAPGYKGSAKEAEDLKKAEEKKAAEDAAKAKTEQAAADKAAADKAAADKAAADKVAADKAAAEAAAPPPAPPAPAPQ